MADTDEVAKKIKQEYSGWTLYPVDMFVHETEAKIGGVTDLIAMNSKGQIKVIDFKTRNTKEYKEGKKHQKQLSAYAIALNNTYFGIPIHKYIIPFILH